MDVKSIRHTKAFEMDAPIAGLFPLFSPEGEKLWVPGWDYDNVMGTTELSEDYVFLTRSHDHATRDAIWTVKRFDRDAHLIEFYKIEPDDKVGVVKVSCTELDAHRTRVEVTYAYIALAETGERFISEFTTIAYDEFIEKWKTLLTGYFAAR